MPLKRDDSLQHIFEAAEQAFSEAVAPPPASVPLAARVFAALGSPGARASAGERCTFPVCRFLEPALHRAGASGCSIAAVAAALGQLSPRLDWQRRAGFEAGPEEFFHGHANAVLAGPRGLEVRDDVLVGMSLIAPGVRYPDHHHPPEEFYVVLSPGEWRQQDGPWHEPGVGGVVHNPPGIVHAMRSGDAPLLALWFLWTG